MEKLLRKLCRSYYWQNLYAKSKELSNIYLFVNSHDLT